MTTNAAMDTGWNAAQNAPPEVKSAAAGYATDYATTQATAEVKKTCGVDMTYVMSINGLLKGKQLLWSFLAFLLMCIDFGITAGKVIYGLCAFPLLLCIIVLTFVFATHLYTRAPQVPWFLADLGISAGAGAFQLIFGIVFCTTFVPLQVAAGVFALIAAVTAFAPGTFYSYKRWRESKHIVEQGSGPV